MQHDQISKKNLKLNTLMFPSFHYIFSFCIEHIDIITLETFMIGCSSLGGRCYGCLETMSISTSFNNNYMFPLHITEHFLKVD